jgi:aryl-alcohol dehydrogenase-like predicted oxidoreductase
VAEIDQARKITKIVSVQNSYNPAARRNEDVLDHCTAENRVHPVVPHRDRRARRAR